MNELVPSLPLEVSCPSCDSDEGMPCAEPRFGQEGILADFHPARVEAADAVLCCPACRSDAVAVQHGESSAGEWSAEGCYDCGWRGEPY